MSSHSNLLHPNTSRSKAVSQNPRNVAAVDLILILIFDITICKARSTNVLVLTNFMGYKCTFKKKKKIRLPMVNVV